MGLGFVTHALNPLSLMLDGGVGVPPLHRSCIVSGLIGDLSSHTRPQMGALLILVDLVVVHLGSWAWRLRLLGRNVDSTW